MSIMSSLLPCGCILYEFSCILLDLLLADHLFKQQVNLIFIQPYYMVTGSGVVDGHTDL